jgi:hypothetical protein
MPAGTSAAMAGVASAQAAAASAAAHAARVAQCKATIPNFDAQRATVSEMKEYAGCVETLYPTEIGADATVALKVLFVVALAGMAVGAWRERWYGFGDAAMGGVLGFMLAPLALASIAGLALGIRWLFS